MLTLRSFSLGSQVDNGAHGRNPEAQLNYARNTKNLKLRSMPMLPLFRLPKMCTLLVFMLSMGCASPLFAQLPGAIDPSFNATDIGFGVGDGPNNSVYTTSVQTDGKVVLGGAFNVYNNVGRSNIVRVNSDGSLDNTFTIGSGPDNWVLTSALQTDGKIVIGGWFSSYNGTIRNRIARLNSDGILDASFDPGAGANNTVVGIAIQTDGKIIVGGDFTTYNGSSRNYIARLNSDGSLDATFNPGSGTNGTVRTISVQSDGKILIGGLFSTYNGTSRNNIARLNSDGSLDVSFNPGSGANSRVNAIQVQMDGKILMCGDFALYNGTSRNAVARLNANGTLDAAFNPGTGANSTIYTAKLQTDGKLVIGGAFTTFNGIPMNRVARLSTTGVLDASFNVGSGFDDNIWTTSLQTDGKVIFGGDFNSYSGTGKFRLARLSSLGVLDGTFNPGYGANNTGPCSVAFQSDGKIIIGGSFVTYNGISRNRVARLNEDGTLDLTFNPGSGASSSVYSTVLQPDGKILIGGHFATYNGTAVNFITRLNADGSRDASFNQGAGANNYIRSVILQADGKIIIGGNFTTYNGTSRNRIARLNADGSLDETFDPGFGADDQIDNLVLQPDEKIITVGQFTLFNGISRNRVARLNSDGTLDASFNPGTGANQKVWAAALQSDGKVVIGGQFTTFDGVGSNSIARLNADGSLDATFQAGTGVDNILLSIAIQSDDKIVIGGGFTLYNNIGRRHIARLNADGSLDLTFDPGSGADNGVEIVALQTNGSILFGGNFTSYNFIGRNRLARVFGGIYSIQTFVSPTTLCAGTNVSVEFNASAAANLGNEFTVQLSDASGSFALPVAIGSISSTATSGIISAVIPSETASGAGYRMRLVSSNPSSTGPDNGIDITINAPPLSPVLSALGSTEIVDNQPITLSATTVNNTWRRDFEEFPNNQASTYTTNEDGAYSISVTENGCSSESNSITLSGGGAAYCTPSFYPNTPAYVPPGANNFSFYSTCIATVTTSGASANLSEAPSCLPGIFPNFFLAKPYSGLEAVAGTTFDLEATTTGNEGYWGVWFDWNQNHAFEATELAYSNSTGSPTNQILISVTVPSDAIPGYTRMRILVNPNNSDVDPCGEYFEGNGLDYGLNITQPYTCFQSTSMNFDGVNDGIEVANAESFLEPTELTFEARIKRAQPPYEGQPESYFMASAASEGWVAGCRSNGNVFFGSTNGDQVDSPIILGDTLWHLVSITFGNNSVSFYKDGTWFNTCHCQAISIQAVLMELVLGPTAKQEADFLKEASMR